MCLFMHSLVAGADYSYIMIYRQWLDTDSWHLLLQFTPGTH